MRVEGRPGSGSCWIILAGWLLSASLAACGGGSGGDDVLILGTWVSGADPLVRGRFSMEGSARVKYYSGTLSGTLEFFGADGGLLAKEPVSGTLSEENIGSNPYWSIEFATADGKLSFFSPSYDGYGPEAEMIGDFTNQKSAPAVQGRWHSNPPGGPKDAVIVQAYPLAGHQIRDLAFGPSGLFAVATDTTARPMAGPALYRIDTAQANPVFVAENPTPAPANPAGIAWSGEKFWVASPSANAGSMDFTLDAYRADWTHERQLSGTGMFGDRPESIAYWDGAVWFAPFLNFGIFQIDLTSGQVSMKSSLQLNRPTGFDSDGSVIWVASGPPGGVWAPLLRYQTSGTVNHSLYAPEPEGGSALACEGGGFLWLATERYLYRLDAR